MSYYNIFNNNLVKFTPCLNKYKYMKNDFDNLTLRYLSIYNEGYSSEYGEDERDYAAERQRMTDKVRGMIKYDEGESHYTPEQQRAVDDIMSRIKITGGSHEDNESEYGSEYGDHYRRDADSPRNNYGHPRNAGKYPDDVDYKDNVPAIKDDCEECGNEGCVGDDGYCHYCNLEDEDEDRDEDGENYRPYHT